MESDRLGVYSQPQFSTGVPVAATDDSQSARLRRPPSALSYSPDSVYQIPRFAVRDEGRLSCLCHSGRCFVLLAAGALSNPLFAGLVSGAACLLRSLSVPAQ